MNTAHPWKKLMLSQHHIWTVTLYYNSYKTHTYIMTRVNTNLKKTNSNWEGSASASKWSLALCNWPWIMLKFSQKISQYHVTLMHWLKKPAIKYSNIHHVTTNIYSTIKSSPDVVCHSGHDARMRWCSFDNQFWKSHSSISTQLQMYNTCIHISVCIGMLDNYKYGCEEDRHTGLTVLVNAVGYSNTPFKDGCRLLLILWHLSLLEPTDIAQNCPMWTW